MLKEKDVRTRLRKIKGQIEGVEKMLAEKRSCEEILQQLQAIRSAIKEVMILLIESDVCRVLSFKKKEQLIGKLKLLFKIR